jgi:hypothetical protein
VKVEMAKKMIIKGVGTFMAKRTTAQGGTEVVTLGNLQDLKITFTVDIEDIFGGDGLFAIDTLIKSKAIEITATDAKFDLDAVSLMLGSTVQEGVTTGNDAYVYVLNEQGTINGTGDYTPDFAATVFDGDFQVRFINGNKLLTKVASNPQAGEYALDTTTVVGSTSLEFNVADANKDIAINYKRKETVDMTPILVDEVPFPVIVVHHGSFQQKDGTYQGIETELFSCRAQGSFSIDAARATASAMNVSLKVIDPERADGRMGTIKRYSANSRI